MERIEKITSRNNGRLVHARKVRDGKAKAQIFIEGKRLVGEALRSGVNIDECFVVDGFGDSDLIEAVELHTSSIFIVSGDIFDSIADTSNPQGIILIAARPSNSFLTDSAEKLNSTETPLFIFLNEINNPSNLGAILRTAEAAGVSGVVVSVNSADVYSAKSIRSAMGAAFRMLVWEDAEFDDVLTWAARHNLTTTAAVARGDDHYSAIDWKTPRLLILGSEAHGLSKREIEKIETTVRIPMENSVESLNLAVSAGIILFEAKRQRDGSTI